jgi:AcrR family transcriptional regulator
MNHGQTVGALESVMARRQQEKSLETLEELRDSAISLFGSKGFVQTTIADITRNAGYAKGNFYRYWKSKDDLFLTIMEERFRAYRKPREEALARARSVEEALDVIMTFLETIIDDGKWARIFLEFTIHASKNETLRQELHKSMYRLSGDLFATILAPFNVSDYPLNKMGALVAAMFEGFLIQSLLGMTVIDKNDLMRAILTLITRIAETDVPDRTPQSSGAGSFDNDNN